MHITTSRLLEDMKITPNPNGESKLIIHNYINSTQTFPRGLSRSFHEDVTRDSRNVHRQRRCHYQLMKTAERHHYHLNLLPHQRTGSAQYEKNLVHRAHGLDWSLGPQFLRIKNYLLLN